MHRKLSLERTIAEIVAVFYTVVLVLLCLWLWYIRANYRNTIQNDWKNTLNRYGDQIEQNIQSINSNLYEMYSYDDNFRTLQTAEGLDCMSAGYQLDKQLRTLEVYEQRNTAYLLYYNDVSQRKYYFNTSVYGNGDIEAIKDWTDAVVNTQEDVKGWFYKEINGKEYDICIYRVGHVALCEICNLADFRQQLEKELEEYNAIVCYEKDGDVLGGVERRHEHKGDAIVTDGVVDSVPYTTYKREIGNTGLYAMIHIPTSSWTFLNVQQGIMIILILASIVLVVVLFHWIQRELIRPLRDADKEMERISEGDMDRRISAESRFIELQKNIDTINTMVDEIQKQKLLSYEQTIEKQQAQMQFLTVQLKPHFYLNSLKRLNVLAINGENDMLQDIILKLSEHMRTLLQIEKARVPLEQELACVRNYAELQSETLERPIHLNWQVEVKQDDWLVPNLCIETFVENSVKYAKLGSLRKELEILIQIHELETEEGIFLDVYIRDNGQGYPEDVLEMINDVGVAGSRCVGINNLKRRCEILYGEGFEYAFANMPGATASLIFPKETRSRDSAW